jgi:hypothetical protein
MRKPTAFFLRALVEEVQPHILLLCVIAVIAAVLTWRRRDRWEQTLLIWPAGVLLLVSFSSAPNHRHVLPVIVLMYFIAALFLWRMIQAIPISSAGRMATIGLIATAAVALDAPRCFNFTRQFGDGSRARLRQWVTAHVTPGAAVVEDSPAGLSGKDPPPEDTVQLSTLNGGIRLHSVNFAPQIGSLAQLTEQGISHVVVCDIAYGRYFDPEVIPVPGFQAEYLRRRRWYDRLFHEARLVWRSAPSPPTYSSINPEIRVYRLPSASTGAAGAND